MCRDCMHSSPRQIFDVTGAEVGAADVLFIGLMSLGATMTVGAVVAVRVTMTLALAGRFSKASRMAVGH
jgi:hypothetical protein